MKTPEAVTRKELPSAIRKAGAPRTFEFTISTGDVYRENDVIAPAGWVLSNYLRNPVVLLAHDYTEPPIARATDVRVVNGALRATVEFPEPGTYDRADAIRRLVEQDFIRATSVGFRPLESTYNAVRGGVDFARQELLELSIVPVPANPQCLVGPTKSIDRARLEKFFGSPRGSDLEFDLASIPSDDGSGRAEVGLTRAQVLTSLRDVVSDEAARRVRSHVSGLVGADAQVIELEDEVEAGLTRDDVVGAMREAVTPMVADGVRRAVNRARGRID